MSHTHVSRASAVAAFVALTAFLAGASPIHAQGLSGETSAPSEVPPATFAGRQFVDSRGCVFVRSNGEDGQGWSARLLSDGRHICGMKPTLAATQSQTAKPPLTVNRGVSSIRGSVSNGGPIKSPVITVVTSDDAYPQPPVITDPANDSALDVAQLRELLPQLRTPPAAPAAQWAVGPAAGTGKPLSGEPRSQVTTFWEHQINTLNYKLNCRIGCKGFWSGETKDYGVLPQGYKRLEKTSFLSGAAQFKPAWTDGRLNPNRGLPNARANK